MTYLVSWIVRLFLFSSCEVIDAIGGNPNWNLTCLWRLTDFFLLVFCLLAGFVDLQCQRLRLSSLYDGPWLFLWWAADGRCLPRLKFTHRNLTGYVCFLFCAQLSSVRNVLKSCETAIRYPVVEKYQLRVKDQSCNIEGELNPQKSNNCSTSSFRRCNQF